jgi:protein gp37
MHRSKIEWVLNPDNKTLGWVWNPITGCLNHVNGLCKGGGFPCYAYKLANGRLKQRYLANRNILMHPIGGNAALGYRYDVDDFADPFYPRFWEERLSQLIGHATTKQVDGVLAAQPAKGKGIFVCDMSDLFGIGIPEEWTRKALRVIEHTSYNRYYLLTKQAARLPQFSPFPDNAWVGVTATNQESYYDGVSNIAKIEARVKFVSFEPLLEQINGGECAEERRLDSIDEFDWVIIGACTGSLGDMRALRARYPALEIRDNKTFTKFVAVPPPAWVREIITAADAANIPVFIKDNILNVAWGDYRLTEGRREFPKG